MPKQRVQAQMVSSKGRGWEVVQLSNSEAKIRMWGEVVSKRPVNWWTGDPVEGDYIVTSEFLEALEPIKNSRKITIKLNSVGGSVHEAIAIVNTLKSIKAKVIVIVEGVAYSSGFTIANAADTLRVYPGSSLMMHRASTFICDWVDSGDVDAVMKTLKAAEDSALEIISSKTGKSVEELRPMMNETTFMTGRQAVEQGFADELIEDAGPDMKFSPTNNLMSVGGHVFNVANSGVPVEYLNKLPYATLNIESRSEDAKNTEEGAKGEPENVSETTQERTEQKMTQENQGQSTNHDAVQNALQQERARVKAIRDIANMVGDEALVTSALDDPEMTAEKLALQALKNQDAVKQATDQKEANQGAKHLKNIAADSKNSGAEQLSAAPNSGTMAQEQEQTPEQLAAQIASTYNKYNKGVE